MKMNCKNCFFMSVFALNLNAGCGIFFDRKEPAEEVQRLVVVNQNDPKESSAKDKTSTDSSIRDKGATERMSTEPKKVSGDKIGPVGVRPESEGKYGESFKDGKSSFDCGLDTVEDDSCKSGDECGESSFKGCSDFGSYFTPDCDLSGRKTTD